MYQLHAGMSGQLGALVTFATIAENSTPTIDIEKNPRNVMRHPTPTARTRRSPGVSGSEPVTSVRRVERVRRIRRLVELDEVTLDAAVQAALSGLVGMRLDERVMPPFHLHGQSERAELPAETARPRGFS